MRKNLFRFIAVLLLLVISAIGLAVIFRGVFSPVETQIEQAESSSTIPTESETSIGAQLLGKLIATDPTPEPIVIPPTPSQKLLPNDYHIFQTFNNCGPAALSMALSYYNINVSQQILGQQLRPYQNPQGNNDDKSTTLEELANLAEEQYGLTAFRRPNGNMELVEQLIAQDIPVITRTLLTANEDIGHYRVIKGYNNNTQTIIQDDSLQGKNVEYSYDAFNKLWQPFNYEYLILVPEEKVALVTAILGQDANDQVAWQNAVAAAQAQLADNPNDMYAQLNLSVAQYMTGNYQDSIAAFEKVESRLPMRTLWYQIEPIEAYFAAGDYQQVLRITDQILNNNNRAFTELYILRGKVFQAQQNPTAAKAEFEKAVFYNVNHQEAQDLLATYQ